MKYNRGLGLLLEQKVINVKNKIPQFPKENSGSSGSNSESNVTYVSNPASLYDIVYNNKTIQKNQSSPTVSQVKQSLGYSKDKSNNFDNDFAIFLISYRVKKNFSEQAVIDKELICDLNPQISACVTNKKPENTETKSESAVVKYLDANIPESLKNPSVEPDVDLCIRLVNAYSSQAEIYRRSVASGTQDPNIKSDSLDGTKKIVKRCFAFHKLRLKFKFSAMNEITKNQQSPFYIDFAKKSSSIKTNNDKTPAEQNVQKPKTETLSYKGEIVTYNNTQYYKKGDKYFQKKKTDLNFTEVTDETQKQNIEKILNGPKN